MPAVICHIRSTKIGRCSEARSASTSAIARGFVLAADDDGEFVLLEAPQQRARRQSGLQMFGDIHQHGVAAGSPQRIVDLVKAVEIDQREGDDAGTTLRQGVVETLHHGAMIGQSGQGVLADQLAAASAL